MKAVLQVLFGFLVGIIASLLFVSYLDNSSNERDIDIVNTNASRMINELDALKVQKDKLQEELDISNSEITEVIKLLTNKDKGTVVVLNDIRVLVLENKYDDIETLVLAKIKENKWLYFYSTLLKEVKDSQSIYNKLIFAEKEYKDKAQAYNEYKKEYSLYLHKDKKVSF